MNVDDVLRYIATNMAYDLYSSFTKVVKLKVIPVLKHFAF